MTFKLDLRGAVIETDKDGNMQMIYLKVDFSCNASSCVFHILVAMDQADYQLCDLSFPVSGDEMAFPQGDTEMRPNSVKQGQM